MGAAALAVQVASHVRNVARNRAGDFSNDREFKPRQLGSQIRNIGDEAGQ